METAKIKRHGLSNDKRAIEYIFDCPYCKMGKNQKYSTILNWKTHIQECSTCGESIFLNLESYDKENNLI